MRDVLVAKEQRAATGGRTGRVHRRRRAVGPWAGHPDCPQARGCRHGTSAPTLDGDASTSQRRSRATAGPGSQRPGAGARGE